VPEIVNEVLEDVGYSPEGILHPSGNDALLFKD